MGGLNAATVLYILSGGVTVLKVGKKKFLERSERKKIFTPHFRSPGGTFNLQRHIFFQEIGNAYFLPLTWRLSCSWSPFMQGLHLPSRCSPPWPPHSSRWGDMNIPPMQLLWWRRPCIFPQLECTKLHWHLHVHWKKSNSKNKNFARGASEKKCAHMQYQFETN